MKSFHAGRIVEFYNLMTTAQDKEIIDNGRKADRLADAVRLDLSKLTSIDPFNDIDPILGGEPDMGNQKFLPITDISPEELEMLCRRGVDVIADNSSDENSKWE